MMMHIWYHKINVPDNGRQAQKALLAQKKKEKKK